MRAGITALLLSALLSISSCANPAAEKPVAPRDSVELMTLPEIHRDECRRFPGLAPACPASLPVVEASQKRARAFRPDRDHVVFFSEWSGPYPGVTAKNAPPRFVHIVAHAGDLEQAFPFEWPRKTAAVPDPVPTKRQKAILVGNVTWFGKQGGLALAPSFPDGGIDGDHLVFRWTQVDQEYAISIHAWLPLAENIETLKQVVGSTPRTRG
jgi:hypothetical protein